MTTLKRHLLTRAAWRIFEREIRNRYRTRLARGVIPEDLTWTFRKGDGVSTCNISDMLNLVKVGLQVDPEIAGRFTMSDVLDVHERLKLWSFYEINKPPWGSSSYPRNMSIKAYSINDSGSRTLLREQNGVLSVCTIED